MDSKLSDPKIWAWVTHEYMTTGNLTRTKYITKGIPILFVALVYDNGLKSFLCLSALSHCDYPIHIKG